MIFLSPSDFTHGGGCAVPHLESRRQPQQLLLGTQKANLGQALVLGAADAHLHHLTKGLLPGTQHARGWVHSSGQCLHEVLVASPAGSRQPPARPRRAGREGPSMSVRLSRALLAPHFPAPTAVVAALLSLGVLLPTAAPHPDNTTAAKVGEPSGTAPRLH